MGSRRKTPAEITGAMLRDAREDRCMTRARLAKKLGVGDAYLYQVETGRRAPSLEQLWRIADAMGCRVEISFG